MTILSVRAFPTQQHRWCVASDPLQPHQERRRAQLLQLASVALLEALMVLLPPCLVVRSQRPQQTVSVARRPVRRTPADSHEYRVEVSHLAVSPVRGEQAHQYSLGSRIHVLDLSASVMTQTFPAP